MQLSAQLSGQLASGPSAAADGQFPSGTMIAAFNLNPAQKPYNVDTGGTVNVNSANAFVALPGIGAAPGPVTRASLVYVRVSSGMIFRITYLGDANPYLSYCGGLLIIEPDASHPVTLLEVQGAGTVEYYAFGLL